MSCKCGPLVTRNAIASSKGAKSAAGKSRSASATASVFVRSRTSATSVSSSVAPRNRSAIRSARRASPSLNAARAAAGVTFSPKSVGSNAAPTSLENTITPSVVDAHHPEPVGANATCLHRIRGRFFLSALLPPPAPKPPPPPPAPGIASFSFPAPGRPVRCPRAAFRAASRSAPRRRPSSSSESESPGRRSSGPASVTRLESRRSMVPSKALLLVRWNFFSSALPATSYTHTDFESPPARSNAPSALYANVLKLFPAATLAPERKSPTIFPPAMSRRPSMVPSSFASLGSHKNT
mmetsp:Transcript_341/g.1305  ORF Transcript_341/g.1305 Transcript_341/m.1305 type:complete len:295 (-) Transcript_341:1730-2614(-)